MCEVDFRKHGTDWVINWTKRDWPGVMETSGSGIHLGSGHNSTTWYQQAYQNLLILLPRPDNLLILVLIDFISRSNSQIQTELACSLSSVIYWGSNFWNHNNFYGFCKKNPIQAKGDLGAGMHEVGPLFSLTVHVIIHIFSNWLEPLSTLYTWHTALEWIFYFVSFCRIGNIKYPLLIIIIVFWLNRSLLSFFPLGQIFDLINAHVKS